MTVPLKNAQVSISTSVGGVSLGPKQSPVCSVNITAPDLTASTPLMSGASTGVANEFYEGLVTISGSLTNDGTADIPMLTTDFANHFRYRPKGAVNWNYLAQMFLTDLNTDFRRGTSRPVQSPPPWVAGEGVWEFLLVADANGVLSESNEGNNNSGILTVTIKRRPPGPSVSLLFNNQINAATIPYAGGGELSWVSTNTSACRASTTWGRGDWTGSVTPLSGKKTLTGFTQNGTFTIVCDQLPGTFVPRLRACVVIHPILCGFRADGVPWRRSIVDGESGTIKRYLRVRVEVE